MWASSRRRCGSCTGPCTDAGARRGQRDAARHRVHKGGAGPGHLGKRQRRRRTARTCAVSVGPSKRTPRRLPADRTSRHSAPARSAVRRGTTMRRNGSSKADPRPSLNHAVTVMARDRRTKARSGGIRAVGSSVCSRSTARAGNCTEEGATPVLRSGARTDIGSEASSVRFAMRSEPHTPTARQRSRARAGTRTHECAHHASTDAHAHDCVRTFMHGAHLWLWRQRNTAVVRVKGVRNPPQSTQEAPDSKIPCRVGYHAVCRTPCRAGYRAVWDTVQSRRRYGRGEPSPGADALDACVQRESGEAPESALLPSSGQNATVHSAWYAYRSSVCTQSCGWSTPEGSG